MRPSLPKSASSSSIVRRNSAYVEVPSAPYQTPRKNVPDSGASSSKENTPMRPNRSSKIIPSESISVTRKRKLSDASHKAMERPTRTEPSTKKARLAEPSPEDQHEGSHDDAIEGASDSSFYCHQCNRKCPWSNGVQCTRKLSRGREGRCGAKYCGNCLRNRYDENLDDIRKRKISFLAKKDRSQYAVQEGIYYDCPRCRDICNCSPCRKHKGLQPTGKLVLEPERRVKDVPAKRNEQKGLPVRVTNKGSAASSTSRPKDTGMKKSVPATFPPDTKKGTHASHKNVQNAAQAQKPEAASKAKLAAPAKPRPRPVWTCIDTSLDQASAVARIHIREFVQRFSSVLSIGKMHLDELEEITGTTGEHGARIGEDDDEVEGWVSEPCVKAIILGLLNVIASSTDNHAIAKVAKDPISDVRAAGANLNKIWVALAALRDGLRRVPSSPFHYMDPLPPPANVTYRTTRHTQQTDADLFVGNSAQLVPVVSALIESALHTKAIHEDIERGLEQEKTLARDVREEVSRQKALFDEVKSKEKAKRPSKVGREQHKQVVQDIEHAHSVAFASHIHRYAPAGQDHEGRVYYFLTPSEAEREAALQLIAGKDAKVKINRRRAGLTEEDRRAMRRWSWIVAVWGTLPVGAAENEADQVEDEEVNSDCPRWWGFYEPEEIFKMAEWIEASSEVGKAKLQRRRRTGGDSKAAAVSGVPLETAVFGSSPASSRAPSPMSDLSDDEDEPDSGSDEGDEMSAYMRVDSQGKPVPTKKQLRGLVDGLREYADLLQWRIRRVGGEHTSAEKNGVVDGAIPAKKFYQ